MINVPPAGRVGAALSPLAVGKGMRARPHSPPCRTPKEVADAIRELAVRGAPAIGIAAAYGYALAAARGDDLGEACSVLAAARPTAANLGWALNEVRAAADPIARARELHAEEVERCRRMSTHAAELFGPSTCALTDRFAARNPAFDVTPAHLITAIVTEHGVHHPPYAESLAGLVATPL